MLAHLKSMKQLNHHHGFHLQTLYCSFLSSSLSTYYVIIIRSNLLICQLPASYPPTSSTQTKTLFQLQYLPFEQIDSAFRAIVAHMAPHSIFYGNECFSTYKAGTMPTANTHAVFIQSYISLFISIKCEITRQKQMLLKIMCVRVNVFIVLQRSSKLDPKSMASPAKMCSNVCNESFIQFSALGMRTTSISIFQ